jgi:hypothetical protein
VVNFVGEAVVSLWFSPMVVLGVDAQTFSRLRTKLGLIKQVLRLEAAKYFEVDIVKWWQ